MPHLLFFPCLGRPRCLRHCVAAMASTYYAVRTVECTRALSKFRKRKRKNEGRGPTVRTCSSKCLFMLILIVADLLFFLLAMLTIVFVD
jgi:hypothetical protein